MTDAFDKQTGASPAANRPEAIEEAVVPEVAEPHAAAEPDVADEVTGASPGTVQACTDLGLNSLEANLARFNIKPPGVS